MRGEQCFVGGDDGFAQPQRAQDHFTRRRRAAHQFDDQVDVRVLDDAGPIGSKQRFGDLDRALFGDVAHGHFSDVQPDTETGGDESAIALNGLKHATTHGAAADNAQIHLVHQGGKIAAIPGQRQSFLALPLGSAAGDF